MKTALTTAIACSLVLATCREATAADEQLATQLEKIREYQAGDNPAPLVEVERMVMRLGPEAGERLNYEVQLLECLKSADSKEAQAFLINQLRVVGTDRSVSTLAPLLTDEHLSSPAFRALAGIDRQAAVEALFAAIDTVEGDVQIGIINVMGEKRFAAAVPKLADLLDSDRPSVARAATRALGKIGGVATGVLPLAPDSVKATAEFRNAWLEAAKGAVSNGEMQMARHIYKGLYQGDQGDDVRYAGLRGLLLECDEDWDILLESIDDPLLRRDAIALSSEVAPDDKQLTIELASKLGDAAVDDQVLLLRALAVRGDASAADEVIQLFDGPEARVQIAAAEALGRIGDARHVRPLLGAATDEGPAQQVARAALQQLSGDSVDATLASFANHAVQDLAVTAIDALASRQPTTINRSIQLAAQSPRDGIRLAAIQSIGRTHSSDSLDVLLELARNSNRPDDGPTFTSALNATVGRRDDKSTLARKLLAALEQGNEPFTLIVLPVLSRIATQDGLAYVSAKVEDDNEAIESAAIRTLASWPDAGALDGLVKIIESNPNPDHRETAIAGFVRLAADQQDAPQRFVQLISRVRRTNERKMVLAALGQSNADSREALSAALSFLDDDALQATAGLAALRIANRVRRTNESLARTSLNRVIETVSNDDVRNRAREVINDMDKLKDHILVWESVGPYTDRRKNSGEEIYRAPFGPEAGEEELEWRPITAGVSDWSVDLEATYGALDYVAAYCRTRIWSPRAVDAQLEMGADDALRVWLNDKVVWDRMTIGGISARQHRVKVELKEGWNDLMMKVVDHQGGWAFSCRVRAADGAKLEGLRYER